MILIGGDPLTRFLNRAAETPFAWGSFDCLLWLADLIAERCGIDPAADLRGTYSTMLAAARVVKDAGGMTKLVEGCVAPLGIKRAKIAARGDIAIVRIGGDGGGHFGNLAGGILLGGTVALICQAGLVLPKVAAAPPVAIWRV